MRHHAIETSIRARRAAAVGQRGAGRPCDGRLLARDRLGVGSNVPKGVSHTHLDGLVIGDEVKFIHRLQIAHARHKCLELCLHDFTEHAQLIGSDAAGELLHTVTRRENFLDLIL